MPETKGISIDEIIVILGGSNKSDAVKADVTEKIGNATV